MNKTPKTFLVGITQPDYKGLKAYLEYTGQSSFLEDVEEYMAKTNGDPLCLVSFYAKLCYKSLVLGKNANVTRVRDIQDNLMSVIQSGHGSVLEHVWMNFVTTDCSRVFTHELVRHRVGTAFSQTSGRYVAIDHIDLVLPPDLTDAHAYPCPECTGDADSYYKVHHGDACPVCHRRGGDGMISIVDFVEHANDVNVTRLKQLRAMLIRDDMPFADKKRITSAIRRLAPNGQTNEIGWSCNVRSLRHMIEMRTSRHAEWEIRQVFDEVACIVEAHWPLMLTGGVSEVVDGVREWRGLKI